MTNTTGDAIDADQIRIIAVKPTPRSYHKETGNRVLAKLNAFLVPMQVTLRGLLLTHDEDKGFVVVMEKPKKGNRQWQMVAGSAFAKVLASAAEREYKALLDEDIDSLRNLYLNFK
ncbi:MAG: hypothetical protein PGN20_09875 [Agrobacterium cavarae]